MPDSDYLNLIPEHQQLHEILGKILTYQCSLSDGRAVDLDELQREGALSAADMEFLASHSVTYKPHRLSDYHAGDMLHMPTPGGCVFLGPSGPEPSKRTASLSTLDPIIESFLKLPRPQDELLLHIQFTEHDGVGVSPGLIGFTLRTHEWRERLPAIRSVAAELGLQPFQDEEVQVSWILSLRIEPDPALTAAALVALLDRGCGFTDETKIIYSAGALDEAGGAEPLR